MGFCYDFPQSLAYLCDNVLTWTSVAMSFAKCELVTELIFPSKIKIFNLIEFSMPKNMQSLKFSKFSSLNHIH